MSFWTGLEALSGHRPGAFTGMTMKDLFDKDMWDRLPRTWSGQRTPTGPLDIRTGRAGEPMTTAWRVGGNQADNEAAHTQHAMANRPVPYPNMSATYPAMPAQTRTFPLQESNITSRPLPAFVPGVSPTQGLDSIRQWGGGNPNTRGMMWGDPTFSGIPGQLGTTWGAGLGAPTATPPMLDKTTVVTESENPNEFNTTKTTYKQQVPANPTNTLMNMGRKFISGYQDLARRRLEEEMLRRQRGC